MLIPSKFSGYQAGIRTYPVGGGGGGGDSSAPPAQPAPVPVKQPWEDLAVNTQAGYNALQQTQAPGATAAMKGQAYNQLLSQGFDDAAIRSSSNTLFGNQSDANWNTLAVLPFA